MYILCIYIIFFEAVAVLMCNHFPRLLKTHFFYLFCKYFAAILVASSVQVTLQFYFQIFYSNKIIKLKIVIRLTKLIKKINKIVIRLTKLKNTNC